MITILEQVADNAKDLTDGHPFTSNLGGTADIIYHINTMQPRPKTIADEVAPFCLARVIDFTMIPSRRTTVELLYCLHQPDRDQAITDLSTLAGLLEPLGLRGRSWSSCKVEAIAGHLGEKDSGLQPHPQYYLSLRLSLIAAPITRQGAIS